MIDTYTPSDWFWTIAGDKSRAWSSAAGAYVEKFDPDRTTNIASEQELSDVLRLHGLRTPVTTEADYSAAIQAHIDGMARSKGYGDGYAMASYVASTVPGWAAEATAFVTWRDAVWSYAYQQLALVQSGGRPQPTIEEMLLELPKE